MLRRSGRAVLVAVVLAGSVLVEAGVAAAAPRPGALPTRVDPVLRQSAAPVPVLPGPAAAARDAVGSLGTVAVLVQPLTPPAAPGTTADAAARSARGTSSAGPVDRSFPTASLVKLYLAEGVLAVARAAGTTVPAEDLARIQAMLTTSDDAAASQLWVTYDGPRVVVDVAARYGLTGTAPPAPYPGAWGETITTAVDVARFLGGLGTVAHADDAALLLGALAMATPVGADGFDQAFGLLGPATSAPVQGKQGWMCCVDGLRNLHSVGIVDDRVVVLLAEFPTTVDWPAARAALDAATAALAL